MDKIFNRSDMIANDLANPDDIQIAKLTSMEDDMDRVADRIAMKRAALHERMKKGDYSSKPEYDMIGNEPTIGNEHFNKKSLIDSIKKEIDEDEISMNELKDSIENDMGVKHTGEKVITIEELKQAREYIIKTSEDIINQIMELFNERKKLMDNLEQINKLLK